jgi:hypothetical protein
LIVAEEALAASRMRPILKHAGAVIIRARRGWRWIGRNDKQLVICFALIAGLYALFEYRSHEDAEREHEVARYVQLQGAEHIASARSKLEALMNGTAVSGLNNDTYGPFFENLINDRDTVAAVLVELKFFDSLDLCVDSSRCSKELACKYFFLDAEGFLQNFRPLLLKLQVRDILDTDSTAYLRQFAHHHCHADLKRYCSSGLINFRSVDCKPFRATKFGLQQGTADNFG